MTTKAENTTIARIASPPTGKCEIQARVSSRNRGAILCEVNPFEEIARILMDIARKHAKTLARIERVIWMLLAVLLGAMFAAGITLLFG
jgi:hypothetical protein